MEHFLPCFQGIYITLDHNYKPLITFQQVDIYLNEPIKIDKLIKLANQSTERHTCDRNGKDNSNSYFRKQKKK